MQGIAIIGMGCRFARATNPEEFFELLKNGVDATGEVPDDRWNLRSFYDSDRRVPGKLSTPRGGFLPRIDGFDAHFFGISPREAAYMDPQQRLLLETSWEAFEDAGLVPEQLAGKDVGVFMGAFTLDYKGIQLGRMNRHLIDAHTATGSMMTMVSNRLSYVFDLRGPSLSVDTACSSSLVSVHLACQSIRNGECIAALAGGVNVMVTPEYTIAESKGGFLAPDGRSKPFSARANGYGRAEGAGVVVLKPVDAALADGDKIYAVIRGSAVNQDGRTNGITVPSGEAQERLIREACRRADVLPRQIHYVEAHGTGTPVGDPIEIGALAAALGDGRPQNQPCVVGSVKGNIGHMEAGAGVAGLIKTALCLQHQQIPPNLHFEEPNPKIPFSDLPLRVPTELEPWPAGDTPRLASVNSFGFGGTNAHVILEEAPRATKTESTEGVTEPGSPLLIPLSARSAEALQAMAASMRDFAAKAHEHGVTISDVYHSTAVHRSHHDYRLGIIAGSCPELASLLDAHLAGEARPAIASGARASAVPQRLVFVCTGMGPQWWAMGRRLFADEPVFRQAILECDEVFRRLADWSLLMEMMADESQSRMAETQVAQTANFAIQVGVAALWKLWGIEPGAIVGHSVGEVSAAYLSGALTLDDAIRVSFHRSRLQQTTAGSGAMLAVGLPGGDVTPLLAPYRGAISIAAVNSPSSTTVSGDSAAIGQLAAELEARQVFHRALRVNVAYHSAQMDPLRDPLLAALATIEPRQARIPLYSTVTGHQMNGTEFDAEYWWRNVREPVVFRTAMDALAEEGFTSFLEVGPHPVLASSISECLSSHELQGRTFHSLRRGEDERSSMLNNLAALYAIGLPVKWEAFSQPNARRVALPAYPWQRERYWNESEESLADRIGHPEHPLLGTRTGTAQPAWEVEISPATLAYLNDHAVRGAVVFPGAAYVEMGIAAGQSLFGNADFTVDDIRFERALFLPEGERPKAQLSFDAKSGGFEVHSRNGNGEWVRNALGRLAQATAFAPPLVDVNEIQTRCPLELGREDCYERFASQGFNYGPAFQKIDQIRIGDGEAVARFEDLEAPESEYRLHPTVLDACFQVLVATDPLRSADGAQAKTYLPVGIQRVSVFERPQGALTAWARLDRRDSSGATGTISLFDESGRVFVEVSGFEVKVLDQNDRTLSPGQADRCIYDVQWSAAPADADRQRELAPGAWLIFADQSGTADRLAALIEAQGARVVLVEQATEYAALTSGRYSLNPSIPEHFTSLVTDVERDSALAGIVHLWSLDLGSGEFAGAPEIDRAGEITCLSVLHAVQALANGTSSPRLWLITRGAQPVAGTRSLALAQTPVWGLGRVIGHQEHIGMWGGLIDLDPAAPPDEAEHILSEMCGPLDEDQVAFRDGGRYVARLRHSTALKLALPVRFRPDASYLVTGGFGALGLLTARWMAEGGARRIILMGRTTLPERSRWDEVAPGTESARRIAAIRELESIGATVVLAKVDVAEESELADFLRQYEREAWPPIRGVVHSAGLVRDELLLHMDAESFSTVLRPKMHGAWNLHRLLAGAPLDFFVLYSSIASLVVSTGQGNYAAANAFLDALAHHRRGQGLPALSINWGPWAVGMVNDLNLTEHYAMRGLDVITPQQGMQFLARLIGQPVAQAAVVSATWPKLFEFQPKVSPMVAELAVDDMTGDPNAVGTSSAGDFLQTLFLAEPDDQPALVEEQLQVLAARVLRMDRERIDTSQPLNAFGLDSMMATELKNRIELSFEVPVSVLDLLKGVSLRELTAILMPKLVEANAKLQELMAA